ncbi:MAG: transcription-repair coupling factor, partial [Candidatus Tectomicrobia bacterium]|nr:transcription-repair coupling factor [Candidatus Tectomicrobia bacterium]
FPGIESLSPFLYPHLETLASYFPKSPVLVLDEPQELRKIEKELRADLQESTGRQKPREPFLPTAEAFYISLAELSTAQDLPVVELSALNLSGDPAYIPFPLVTEAARPYGGRLREFLADLQGWHKKGEKIVLVAPTAARRQRLSGLLRENDLDGSFFESFAELVGENPEELPVPYGHLSLCLGELSSGFSLPALGFRLLTDDDIFHTGIAARKPRSGLARDGRAGYPQGWHPQGGYPALRVHDFRDLNVGDFVVHLSYGIGLYLGLKTLETQAHPGYPLGATRGDFLEIEYADHDKLYLPVDMINMVQKYRGAGSAPPRLDKLGSSSWEGVKKRVKKSLKEMAQELLKLYARRQLATTTPFDRDTQWHQEFAAAFEFEETEDQQAAIEDVRGDMEQSRPMDRLICGDVGYGKTEVAIRAAFKAAYDSSQVAVVVPTTLLAQQHFQTFKARFAPFPISVDVLSRFRSPREQKEILRRLQEGTLDIVIGTHRLLQKDVVFKNLGLVVIDEEQRFGVRHKERLKQLRESVHILTLTATPIPRTLQMSLVGFRDLSVIDTPPADRLSIRTLIRRFSERVLREAVDNELSRGGQIFFVHNRVESIDSMERYLRRLFPEIRIAVAHGQMLEKALERVMVRFLDRKIDLLLCSTIIESGLDIPAANTIIINRADRMGLSQLYQLRGRVGRDRLQAHAYLLVPGEDFLSAKAKKRLQAVLELSTLGSGFRLAMRDLEIRGAGNLLGAQQSGHIAAVGFDLYCKLLEEAVTELKGEKVPEKVETKVSVNADGYIPRSYLPDPKERLMIYKRLYSIQEPARLEEMEKELRDRFGHLPPPVERLVQTVQIRVMAAPLKVLRVERSNQHLTLTFHKSTPLSAARILELAGKSLDLRFIGEDTLQVKLSSPRWETVFPEVKNLLQRLESCATVT